MDFVLGTLRADWEALLGFAPRLIYGLMVLVVFLIAGHYLVRLVARIAHRRPSFTVGAAYSDEPQQVLDLLEEATRGESDVLTEKYPDPRQSDAGPGSQRLSI
jgi:hypothetical protein